MSEPLALPEFLQRIEDLPPAEAMMPPAELADALGGLMMTWGELHQMLARGLTGQPVTRAEVSTHMARLVIQASTVYERLR